MIYELRVYDVLPGRMPAMLKRFEDHTLRIFDRLGIRQAGFFTTVVGESHLQLTYLLAWASLADRETKWQAFTTDPEWIKARDASEKTVRSSRKSPISCWRPRRSLRSNRDRQ